jgi:hypothetical protein
MSDPNIPGELMQELEKAGAKRALPLREPGWYTKSEIEQAFGAPYNDRRMTAAIKKLVAQGKLLQVEVYDEAVSNHCIVYKYTGGDPV